MSGIKPVRAGLLGCGGFALLVVALFVVAAATRTKPVAVVTAATTSQPVAELAAAPTPQNAPPPTAIRPPVVAQVGDTITFTDSVWSVTKVEDLGKTAKSNNQFQPSLTSDGGRFIRVVVKVTNLEKQEERLLIPPKVADDQGREFNPVELSTFFIPQGKKTFQLEAMPPSLPREFWEVYEVAGDSTGLRFMARELSAATHVHPVNLGLK